MGLFDPSKKIGPNPKPYSERLLSKFYEHSKNTCLEQQMTKKIAVEVDAKICFGKKLKNQQKLVKIVFLHVFYYPFQKCLTQSETIF